MDDYKRSLKKRLILYSVYIVLGVVLCIVSFLRPDDNVISCYGTAFAAVGIIRIIRTAQIMKNDEIMDKCRRSEKDERNIFIANKAKSIAVNIYVILGSVAIMILQFMKFDFAVRIIASNICAFALIYIICYRILQRRY